AADRRGAARADVVGDAAAAQRQGGRRLAERHRARLGGDDGVQRDDRRAAAHRTLQVRAGRAGLRAHDGEQGALPGRAGAVRLFSVDCEIADAKRPTRAARVRMRVDPRHGVSWVPEAMLKRASVRVVKKDVVFVMANGQTITRSAGYAILRVGPFETVDEVVFGQPGDLTLLGARTLEGFGAAVDARRKRLVAAGPHLAAPGDKK